jgi:hypothetical protein
MRAEARAAAWRHRRTTAESSGMISERAWERPDSRAAISERRREGASVSGPEKLGRTRPCIGCKRTQPSQTMAVRRSLAWRAAERTRAHRVQTSPTRTCPHVRTSPGSRPTKLAMAKTSAMVIRTKPGARPNQPNVAFVQTNPAAGCCQPSPSERTNLGARPDQPGRVHLRTNPGARRLLTARRRVPTLEAF